MYALLSLYELREIHSLRVCISGSVINTFVVKDRRENTAVAEPQEENHPAHKSLNWPLRPQLRTLYSNCSISHTISHNEGHVIINRTLLYCIHVY